MALKGKMKDKLPISLDTLLLIILILPHLRYNDIVVALLVIATAVYLTLDIFVPAADLADSASVSTRAKLLFMARLSLVTLIICVVVLGPLMANIVLWLTADPKSDPYLIAYLKHDGAIQTEEAIKLLLQGKNPYAEDYDNTLVARFFFPYLPLNPAIYHYVYLPFTFLLSLPVYIGFTKVLGWYDQRLVYVIAFMVMLLMLPQLARSTERKLSLLVTVGLNLLLVDSLVYGMNDVLVLSLLLLTTYLLHRGWRRGSTIPLALACATKQAAWFFLPFYFLFQFNGALCLRGIASLIKKTYPFFLVFAIEHYVYLPGILLFSLPFHVLSTTLWGFYDQRIFYLAIYLCTVLMLPFLARSPERKLSLLAAVGLNPLLVEPVTIGMNDIAILMSFLLAAILLLKERRSLSALALGLGCASKQTAWLFIPFYLTFLMYRPSKGSRLNQVAKPLGILLLVMVIIVGPFVAWDARAFIDDVFSYPAGTTTPIYPIRGYTLGSILLGLGIISSPFERFPFWILQLVFGIPLLLFLLRCQLVRNDGARMFVCAGFFVLGIGFLSRYFHYNLIGVVTTLITVGVLFEPQEEREKGYIAVP